MGLQFALKLLASELTVGYVIRAGMVPACPLEGSRERLRMSRRVDPAYYEDEEGWDQDRFGEQDLRGQSRGPSRRRTSSKSAYHGRSKRSRRNRDGWDRFDD